VYTGRTVSTVLAEEETMAFAYTNDKGQTYFLHERMVTLRGNNRQQKIYFFSLTQKDGVLDAIPSGWEVFPTKSSGMPVLKKKKEVAAN
jgi:hypothetical protein